MRLASRVLGEMFTCRSVGWRGGQTRMEREELGNIMKKTLEDNFVVLIQDDTNAL
jgi:hypothetical protein